MVAPLNTHEETAEAVRMLRKGATPGMVRQYLAAQGLSEHVCEEALAYAQKSVIRRSRLRALSFLLLGISLIAAAPALHSIAPRLGLRMLRVDVLIAMVGLITSFFGVYGLCMNTR